MRNIVDKSMLGKTWTVATYQDENLDKSDDLLKKILVSRGITDEAAVEKFLNPSIKEYMPDPYVLKDMDKAVKVIADSILSNEKIAIYGDYDVDGITSTAIFVKYLRALGVDVIWHLPTREGEGYGLNTGAIDEIIGAGAKLLISVDCGISGVKEVEYARSHGLKVVITDHHSPDNVLPDAEAVVNPKRLDDSSDLNYLAGVGVAFLTLVGVRRELKSRDVSPEFAKILEDNNLTLCMEDLKKILIYQQLQKFDISISSLMDMKKIQKIMEANNSMSK